MTIISIICALLGGIYCAGILVHFGIENYELLVKEGDFFKIAKIFISNEGRYV